MKSRVLTAVLGLCLGSAEAANYTDFLPGAKARGLGMAFVSIADDPYAMFYNPAGMANNPYVQAGSSLGRSLSPKGTLSSLALTYMRPYEPIHTAVLGAAYLAQRQQNGGDKDSFVFNYAQEFNLPPALRLSKPIKVGGNFKILNAEQDRGAGFGFGLDGGVLVRSNFGLSMGATLMDLTSNIGLPRAIVGLGTSYVWRGWLTLAGDFRIRSNLTEFYPAMEASFHQGLLKARVGRGLKLDYADSIAFGLGFDLSPLIIDAAMSIPWSGINRSGGGYELSVNYRFGAPPFWGQFVGDAAADAERVKTELLRVEERKNSMQSEAAAARANRDSVKGEVEALEARFKTLESDFNVLLKEKEEAAYELQNLRLGIKNRKAALNPAVKPPPPPPKPKWPRQHKVAPGDTLRSISNAYYDDPNQWERIYKANADKVERGLPLEGATLSIPAPSEAR